MRRIIKNIDLANFFRYHALLPDSIVYSDDLKDNILTLYFYQGKVKVKNNKVAIVNSSLRLNKFVDDFLKLG